MQRYLVILFLLMIYIPLNSRLRTLGVSGNIVYTQNHSDMNGFNNLESQFISFNSINYDFNIFSEFHIIENFYLGLEFGYFRTNLENQGTEATLIVINKLPVNGEISHNLQTNFNYIYPGLSLGYRYKSLAISIGSKFPYTTSSEYLHNQLIVKPENIEFINPESNFIGSFENTILPLYLPFARLVVIPGGGEFKPGMISSSIVLEYSLLLNSVISDNIIKYSNISLGIRLGLEWPNNEKSDLVLRDTVFERDTIITYDSKLSEPIISLVSSISEEENFDRSIDTYILKIRETYQLTLPKPTPLLNGELTVVFLTSDSNEVKSCNISFGKKIFKRYFYHSGKFNKELIDTIYKMNIPRLRFYYSYLSEVGIDSIIIKIYNFNQEIKEITPQVIEGSYFDVNLNDIIDDVNSNNLNYKMILSDFEGQKKIVSKGNISLSISDDLVTEFNEYIVIESDIKFDEIKAALKKFNKENKDLYLYYLPETKVSISKLNKLIDSGIITNYSEITNDNQKSDYIENEKEILNHFIIKKAK